MKTLAISVPFTGKFIFQLTDVEDGEDIWKEVLPFIEKQVKQMIDQNYVYNIDIDQTRAQIVERR